MDARDHDGRDANKNNICSLEWIAWAIEAARRHKENEHAGAPAVRRVAPRAVLADEE
jgi:hypothetical protein